MSANERRFRAAARAYAERNTTNPKAILFAHKGKQIICRINLHDDWTKMFHFDGVDTVSIKNRLSEPWGDMITVEAFELAYGKGA